jgi:hypothetical protein
MEVMSSKGPRKTLRQHTLTLEANAKAEAEREQAEAQASDSANATERQAEAQGSDSVESTRASTSEGGITSGSRKKQKLEEDDPVASDSEGSIDSSKRSQRQPERVKQALAEEKRESERRAMSLQLEDSQEQVVALKAQLMRKEPQFPTMPPKPSTVVVNEDPFQLVYLKDNDEVKRWIDRADKALRANPDWDFRTALSARSIHLLTSSLSLRYTN